MNARLLKPGILLRTLLTVMVPLIVVVLVLGYHFTSKNMANARSALDHRGEFMAQQLAVMSAFEVYSGNLEALHHLMQAFLKEDAVVRVMIMDQAGKAMLNLFDDTRVYANSDEITFITPILRTGVSVSDFTDDTDSSHAVTNQIPLGKAIITLSDRDVHTQQQDILFTGTLITMIGMLLSFMLALVVARGVSGPIRKLTYSVSEVTNGNLDARVSETSTGEIGRLERGFNQMAGSLQDGQDRLRREVTNATLALQHTVSQLEKRNAELEQARTQAQRAGDAKSDFLARMSHEIRTPLSAVIGYAQLLTETPQSESQNEYTRTISEAASQLLLIIDDILEFSRLDSRDVVIEEDAFDLHENLENIVAIQSTGAFDKHIELVLLVHSDVPRHVISDAKRINQILTNLISNAIKFTDHGHITVTAGVREQAGDRSILEFSVADTGIGLHQDQVETIFDPFTQGDISISRIYGGTGLGLTICKHLAERMGGNITVKSEPGTGTTFTVQLPVSIVVEGERQPRPLTGLRILLHDGNPMTLRSIRNRLFTWGATVFNTGDHERFMEMLGNNSGPGFDLAITGLPPGHTDNDAIGKLVLDTRSQSDVPLLLMLSSQTNDLQCGGTDCSSVDFITKPPRSDRLLRTIAGLAGLPASGAPRDRQETAGVQLTMPSRFRRLRVLVAEDNNFIQGLLNHIFSRHGIEVKFVADGSLACEIAANEKFDIIFMDMHMPVMDGLEATRTIREGSNETTTIIALTADINVCGKDHAQDSLFNDCLLKPVSEPALLEMLEKWTDTDSDSLPAFDCKPGRQSVYRDNETAETTGTVPAELRLRLDASLRTELKSIRDAVCGGNMDVEENIHQLKGIVDYYQLDELKQGFRSLQHAVTNGNGDSILREVDVLEQLVGKDDSGKPDASPAG